jgi:adenine-specific DNA-methyltransferase
MYPRLKLLQRLLSDDGAIFISIDDNEQANLKLVCDEIFGASNFITELVWQKRKGGGNDSFFIGVDHEYIVVYVKNGNTQTKSWRVPYTDEYLKRYKYEDEKGMFYYDTLSRPGLNNPIIYDVTCPDGSIIKDGTWQISKTTFLEGLNNGEISFIENKAGGYSVVRKVRLPQGKVFRSIMTRVSNKDAADEMNSVFGNKKKFSTPKPQELIIDLVSLVSNTNSIILDSFAGSGTTAHAVLNLNKQDGGNRKFILIEMEDYADTITAERVKRVVAGYADKEPTTGAFDFYELEQPLFNDDGNLNESIEEEKIRQYVFYTETKTPFSEPAHKDNKYFLGKHNDTAYYFNYEKDRITTLDFNFLASIKNRAEQYLIYADNCLLSKAFLTKNNLIFKKIPRDITRF